MSRKPQKPQTPPPVAPSTPDRSWVRIAVGSALIVAAAVIVYLPAVHGAILWDDEVAVMDNPLVKTSNGLQRIWLTAEPTDYFPVTYSSFWFEWRLWEKSTTGYHATNILLHALNAVLVWLALRKLKVPGAWFAGMIFAVHPVCVASVAWITERKNVLSLFFALLAVYSWLEFEDGRKRRWYAAALAAFALALLAKTSVVMPPFVLLGCAWWLRGKLGKGDVLRAAPFFALSLTLGLVTIWFQTHKAIGPEPLPPDHFLSLGARIGWAVWFYIGKLALPIHLSMVYPRWDVDGHNLISFLPDIALATLIVAACVYRKSWGRPLLFSLRAFVITLFPILGFFKMYFTKYSFVADTWQYLCMISIIALGVGVVARAAQRRGGWGRRMAIGAGVLLVISLGALAWRQAHLYVSQEALWRDTIRESPRSWVAHGNYGVVLSRQGRTRESIKHLEAGLISDPRDLWLHVDLALELSRTGRIDEALTHFDLALQFRPEAEARIRYSKGAALADHKRFEAAVVQTEKSLALDPKNADCERILGSALLNIGRLPEAVAHLRKSIALDPNEPE